MPVFIYLYSCALSLGWIYLNLFSFATRVLISIEVYVLILGRQNIPYKCLLEKLSITNYAMFTWFVRELKHPHILSSPGDTVSRSTKEDVWMASDQLASHLTFELPAFASCSSKLSCITHELLLKKNEYKLLYPRNR